MPQGRAAMQPMVAVAEVAAANVEALEELTVAEVAEEDCHQTMGLGALEEPMAETEAQEGHNPRLELIQRK